MNILKSLYLKAIGSDKTEPNKLFEGFQYGFGAYQYGSKNATKYINKGYVENIDVNAVISRIAEAVGSINWVVKEKKGEEIEINTSSRLNELLKKPNNLQSWSEFQESVSIMYNTTGNIYINGTEAVGFSGFAEISVLPSQITTPITGNSITPVKGYQLNGSHTIEFTEEEVLHIKRYDPRLEAFSSFVGLSPLESAILAYTSSTEKWEAMASILKNRGAMGIVTSKEGRGLTAENSKELETLYKSRYGGGAKFGTPMFTNASLEFIPMGMSAEDLKLMDQGVISLRAICNIFKVDSSLFNDPANKTFNNRKEAQKAFYTDCIIPFLNKLKESYNSFLTPSYSEAENAELFLDYDLTKIEALQEDYNEKAKTSGILIDSGIISQNEARVSLGLGRIEGVPELDEYSRTKATTQQKSDNLE